MHLARVDTKYMLFRHYRFPMLIVLRFDFRGRTIEWYKNFGNICALNLARIRDGLKPKSTE